jgi:hypothetical protein
MSEPKFVPFRPRALCCAAGPLNDLYALDLSTLVWEDLGAGAAGDAPTPRRSLGFAAAGGELFVFGGLGEAGSVPQS